MEWLTCSRSHVEPYVHQYGTLYAEPNTLKDGMISAIAGMKPSVRLQQSECLCRMRINFVFK